MILMETGDTLSGQASAANTITVTLYGEHVGVQPELKQLDQRQVPASATTLYTVPGGVQAKLLTIIITNPTGSAATIKLWHNGTGDANVILPTVSIGAGEWAIYAQFAWSFYTSSGLLKTQTSSVPIVLKEGGSIVASSITTMDFGPGFDTSESPAGEANISLDLSELVLSNITEYATDVTEVGTGAATAETDLITETVTGGDIAATGGIRITAAGTVTGTTNTKTVRLKIGTTTLATLTYAAGDTGDYHFEAVVLMDGGLTAQKASTLAMARGGAASVADFVAATEAFGSNVIVKVTGQTTDAADEITCEFMLIEEIP